jgi:hypothetical protein
MMAFTARRSIGSSGIARHKSSNDTEPDAGPDGVGAAGRPPTTGLPTALETLVFVRFFMAAGQLECSTWLPP